MADIEDIADLGPEIPLQDEAGAPNGVEKPAKEATSTSNDVSNTVVDDDLLSIAKDVVDSELADSEAAASSASEKSGQAADDPTLKQPDDENFSDVPFNKHPRFQALLSRVKTAEADQARYRNVENFVSNAGLEAPEAADGLRIMGLAKTNPVKAWDEIKPWLQRLAIAAGEVLPQDLQQQVAAGQLDPNAAMALSRARALAASADAQRQFDQNAFARRESTSRAGEIQGTVASWESDRRRADPNFESKLPAVMREIAYLQTQEGRPTDPAGARAQLDRAYRAVSAAAPAAPATQRRPAPAGAAPAAVAAPARSKPAITPVRSAQAAGNPHPKPKRTLDIIDQVVSRRA